MTTTIKSSESERRMTLDLSGGDAVITIFSGDVIAVDAIDFIDAVRSELGVLTIDKADLPEVVHHGRQLHAGEGAARARFMWGDAATMRAYALSALALAEYLEAHPPVDEQQVEALASDLEKATDWDTNQQRDAVARHLVQAGYTKSVQP